MPTYRYKCLRCKKEFEIFHSITTTIKKCPYCGGKLEKVITPNAGIIFKGSGFYETDYKRKGNGNGGNGNKNTHKPSIKREEKSNKNKKDKT